MINRTIFFNKTTVNGVEELDSLDSALSQFKMKYKPAYYMITGEDIYRPDLISFKLYKTKEYWWVLLLINGIMNPFNDMYVGQVIKVPSMFDIYEFRQKYKKR